MNRLDDILRRYTLDGEETAGKITGAAFVVTGKNGIIYSGSSGRLGLDAKSPPWTDKTLTWAASLTKLVTTIALMQLVEQGKLHLDADTRPLVPELRDAKILRGFDAHDKPVYEENTQPITLRQLLTHTAGFSYEFCDPVLLKWSRLTPGRDISHIHWSRREITVPLRFAPGEGWLYGVGLDWAAQVLEAATGMSIGQYMQVNIFDGLGLADTGFWPGRMSHTAARTAASTQRKPDGILEAAPWPIPDKHELEAGGSGLFTTAADYARLLRALLQSTHHDTPLLSARSVREMLTPQLRGVQERGLARLVFHPSARPAFSPEFQPGQTVNHGLGGMLNTHDLPGKRRAGSMTWFGILNSRWWLDPKTGVAAVLFVNVRPMGDPVVVALYDELERAVYGHLVGDTVRSSV
ncbi:hypothetical protein E4U43_004426 [Claviceps pusilla]|uniref:Beta-lactamase-related domain-containing protein n=1 Tax=Claviceps pusilla TaxID=123648 RepID=A0A9P7N3F5_9HYPO|nr:hypothetical protein E4U43_004426 [Claviceps pusilla]